MPFSRPRATRAHGLTPLLTALICLSTHAGSRIDFRTHAGAKPIAIPRAQMQATRGVARAESAEPELRYRWIGLRRAMPADLAIRLRGAGAVVLGCAGRYPGGIVYTVDMGSRAGEALEVLRGSEAFIGVVSIDAADKTPPGLDTLGGLKYGVCPAHTGAMRRRDSRCALPYHTSRPRHAHSRWPLCARDFGCRGRNMLHYV